MLKNAENYQAFLAELMKLGEMFCDPMSEIRMDLYWQTLAPKISLGAWQYACAKAMEYEQFHKVPLPSALMGYVREYQQKESQERGRIEYLAERTRLVALETERNALQLMDDAARPPRAIDEPGEL